LLFLGNSEQLCLLPWCFRYYSCDRSQTSLEDELLRLHNIKGTSTRVKESEAISKYQRQVLDEFSDESEEEERLSFGARNSSFKQGDSDAGLYTKAGSQEEEVAEESEDEDDENPWLGW
jgi:hypothetical protein